LTLVERAKNSLFVKRRTGSNTEREKTSQKMDKLKEEIKISSTQN